MPASNSAANLKSCHQGPKFAWDIDIPDTPFWKDVDFRVAAGIINLFKGHELEVIPFDANANLKESDKLRFLLSLVQSKLAASEAASEPTKLQIADPVTWGKLMRNLAVLYGHLDLQEEEARIIETVLSTVTGDKRVPWLNILSDLKLRLGQFAEAETLAREILPWMQTQVDLGVDSPQAMGTTRRLIHGLWMQGGDKQDEARKFITELSGLIDGLGSSKFSKYQEEEREMLQELVAKLNVT